MQSGKNINIVSLSKIYLKNYFVGDIHCGAASAKPLGAQSTTTKTKGVNIMYYVP